MVPASVSSGRMRKGMTMGADDMHDWLHELAAEAEKRGFLGTFVIVRKDVGSDEDDMAMISTHEPGVAAAMLAEAFRHSMESLHREAMGGFDEMIRRIPHIRFIVQQIAAAGFRYDRELLRAAIDEATTPEAG